MKQCYRCKTEKEESEFLKNRGICKKCWRSYYRDKWFNDPTYREKESSRKKRWRQKNIDYCRAKDLVRYENNKEDFIKSKAARVKQKRIENPLFDYEYKLRQRFGNFFRGRSNKNIEKIVGCSLSELKIHLESKFHDGMNWDNYGRVKGCWTVDHVIPMSSAKTPLELEKLFHYSNLQPLWMSDNIKKSNKL
jgi:hypothetical protein